MFKFRDQQDLNRRSALLFLFTRASLVLHCACVQQSVHAKTSNAPEGAAGTRADTALPGFLLLHMRSRSRLHCSQAPTFMVVQLPCFLILYVLTKNIV